MNSKILALAITMLLAFSAVLATASVQENTEVFSSSIEYVPELEISFTDRNVVVFSDDDFSKKVEKDLSEATSKINIGSDLKEVQSGDIIIVDSSWVYTNDSKTISNDLKTIQKNNTPVIFTGNDLYPLLDTIIAPDRKTYQGDENIYCNYIHSDGISYSYCITNSDETKAIQEAYSWTDAVLSDDPRKAIWDFSWYKTDVDTSSSQKEPNPQPIKAAAGNSPHWDTILLSSKSQSFSKGSLVVNVHVQKLMDYDNGEKYFAFIYRQFGEPDLSANMRLADIYAKNKQGQPVLYDHNPPSTSGTSTVSASLGIGISGSGPSANGSIGWSYSISDVVLLNTTQIGTQTINFWHDVSEDKGVGMGYIAEPGVVMKIPSTAQLCHTGLYHEVQFCKRTDVYMHLVGGLISIHTGYKYIDFQKFGFNWMIAVGG